MKIELLSPERRFDVHAPLPHPNRRAGKDSRRNPRCEIQKAGRQGYRGGSHRHADSDDGPRYG